MLIPDQSLDHFKILKKIGEGGMGEVYLAEDQKLARKVALKVLPGDLLESSDRQERFYREAKTAAKISHPNVMAIYDFGTGRPEGSDKDLNYIVMEYIEGESLRNHLANQNISMSGRLKISERIARGLSAAHKLNIVHRDIKTDNIMMDQNGEPKILDFGLAKPFDSVFSNETGDDTVTASQDLTQDGKILGTVTYMSPEQARGETVDARSDIFSFGIMMYKIFSGVYPFDGGDRVSTIAKILEAKHVSIRDKNETLPPELERIIDKCLQKSPDDRYQDSRDLVVDLRTLRRQNESGITDTRSIEMEAYKKKKRGIFKSKIAYSIAGIVIIAAIIMAILDNSHSPGPNILQAKEDALAILGFENKTGDSELDWLTAGLPEIMMTDLAQSGSGKIISRNRVLDYLNEKVSSISDLPRHQDCVEAARSLGASTVLSGSYFKMGDKIRIDARLEDVETGEILFGEKVIGEDPFVLVDSLTQKIALSLNSQEMMANNIDVSAITSSSPEAYKHYIIGMERFIQSFYDEAKIEFEKAIAIDSTFALPYMRIGMGYAMQNRGQQGVAYFEQARKYQDKLPIKERSLLDIYISLWLDFKFDEAIVKMQSFVANYPDDKEGRSFYAILLTVLKKDDKSALAQLDTVMMLDPQYLLALSMYIEIYSTMDENQKAIEYALKMKNYYPDIPEPYQFLIILYHGLALHDDAIRISEELLQKFPDDLIAPTNIISSNILKRNFDKAMQMVDLIKERHGDDPYAMIGYYNHLANLAFWKGRFWEGMNFQKQSLEQSYLTNDSMRISLGSSRIARHFYKFGQKDSTWVYAENGYHWANRFLTMNYPLFLIKRDVSYEAMARPILDKGIENFKASLPQELWELADLLLAEFDACVVADTNKRIEIEQKLAEDYGADDADNRERLGELMVLSGRYEDGLATLSRNTSGKDETTQAVYYLFSKYYIGIANEALGYIPEAIANYEEILKFWNNADIELDIISDTRQRLQRLSS